jgi:putative transposase
MSRPRRLENFSYVGRACYFLTFCVRERRRAFVSAPSVACVLTQIQRAACDRQFAIVAYCFMPDHVHLLVEGLTNESDLPAFVHRAKQFSGYAYTAAFQEPLWMKGYYERVLRPSESVARVARYGTENPVRAGLVRLACEYPYAGASEDAPCKRRERRD